MVYFVELTDYMRLRQHLTLSLDVPVKVGNAVASSRLDCCNSLFRSLSGFSVRMLQSVEIT